MLRECPVPEHPEPPTAVRFQPRATVRRAAPGEDAMTVTEARTARAGEKLMGRVAFVTGGTRGIGAAICHSLASQGAEIAAGYSGNEQAATAFSAEVSAHFPDSHATVHRGDIGSPDDCRRTVHEVIGRHGRLDILVNN